MSTDLVIFLQAFAIGCLISVPVGPVNIMCFNTSISHNRLYAYKLTLGATFADTLFALIAILSLQSVVNFIDAHKSVFEFISGIILLSFSAILFLKKYQKINKVNITSRFQFPGVLSSFLFTISNPITILVFIAYLSNLNTKISVDNPLPVIIFLLGVILGSTMWFLSLSMLTSKFKEKISTKLLNQINSVCSIGLCLFGIYMISKNLIHNV